MRQAVRLTTAQARQQAAALEAQIEQVDQHLARATLPGAEREKAEHHRARLAGRFDRLWEALEFVDDVLPHLPVCVCGKARHEAETTAQRHLSAIRLLGARPTVPRGSLPVERGSKKWVRPDPEIYSCFRQAAPAWHVGHRVVRL